MSLQAGQFKSQNSVESIFKSLLSLFLAILAILTFITLLGFSGYSYNINQIIKYTFTDQLTLENLAIVLFWATPLVLTGLSVAIAFKGGLFNIGGQGQMIIGGVFAGIFSAVIIPQNPILNSTLNSSPFIMIPTVILISMIFGAIWGGIPGFLRAYTGAHEVITTILMNQIAVNVANYLVGSVESPFVDKSGKDVYGQTAEISKNAQILPINIFGSQFSTYLNWSIFIVLIVAILLHFIIWRTNFGFKIRATGYNKTAAEVSGINTKRSIFYSMLIAGALSGLAGGLYVMSSTPYKYIFAREDTMGFDGIAVSLIGLNSPIPILPAAILFGILRQGRIILDLNTNIPPDLVVILQSLVILFASAPYLSAKFYKFLKDFTSKETRKMLIVNFKNWYFYNKKSIVLSLIIIIVPYSIYFGFYYFKINIWTYTAFLDFLMVADMAQSLVLSLALIAICMITYIGYKSTKNFFNTFFSKLENETPNTKIIKFLTFLSIRFAFFVVLIELFVLFLFVLVFISGGRVNFIVYHQDVWQVFVSPIAIRGMIIAAFPIILGAIGGTFNERAGVINIGIEGIMLMSAFGAVFFSFTSGNPFIGIFGGLLFGFITAFIHAALTITFKSEHVVTGVGINLLALGITNLFTTFIWGGGRSDAVAKLPFLNLSNLSGFYNFPIIGLILQILSRQSILFFIGILLIPLLHILLFKTPFGLRLRVIGEEPSAAATAGIPVKSYQYIAVLISGLIASLGGVFLAIGDSQFFQSNMTGGRGFTALAAMIFGKWTVSGSTGSGLFFGYFYSIAIELKSFAYFTNIYRLLSMMPYIIAILVLAGAIGLARPPKSIGKTYDPQN